MNHEDSVFLSTFSKVLGFLVLFTIGLIVLAYFLNDVLNPKNNPVAESRLQEQIKPVGQVYSGETGLEQIAAATPSQTQTTEVPLDGSLDGKLIYDTYCTACHAAGIGGAPKLEAAAWGARQAQGFDTLLKHAIEGYQGSNGYMPPRGGQPALTDDQVKASIEFMLAQLK